MRPKHVELRIHQQNYLVTSSWHFTSFHDEDAQSNNPQIKMDITEIVQETGNGFIQLRTKTNSGEHGDGS